MIKGNCLCQSVRYEIEELRGPLIHCHCNFCRHAHSAAFSSNLTGLKSHFLLVSGEEVITSYESSPGKKRYFCSNCGSPLWHTKETTPEMMTFKLGAIEAFPDYEQQQYLSHHINCGSGKPWMSIEVSE